MEASSRFLDTKLINRHKDALNGSDIQVDKNKLFDSISKNLVKNNATIVSHYYVDPLIQEITEETGGFVGDSLEMAKFGSTCQTENLVVCGVKFMAETAKILSPEKNIFVPTLESTCSLDLGCPAPDLKQMKDQYPDEKLNKLTDQLNIDLKKSEEYGDELRATLNKHNLTHLANKKPGLIENRMQDKTDALWKDLESITGATPSE